MREDTPILIEISPGELIDRLTILQIRASRVSDPAQVRAVRRELQRLTAARDVMPWLGDRIEDLESELAETNESLWDLENQIRCAGCDSGIAALAREICRANDRRSELKRRINWMLGSPDADEKLYAVGVALNGDL